MKKNVFFVFASLVLFAAVSCTQHDDSKNVLTERIQYDVPIKNPDPNANWWVQNLVGPDREALVIQIFNKAKSGEIAVYDYFNSPLTPNEVQNMGVDTLIQTLKRNVPPYDEYDTTIITSLKTGDVTKLRFLEEWKMDDQGLLIEKRVLGMAPVKMVDYAGKQYSMPLFWVYFDPEYPGKLLDK